MGGGYELGGLPEPQHWTRPPRGRVLCFSPHPDDEVIGPGGALALHAAQGDVIRVVVATDGASGDPDGIFGADLPQRRRAETRTALSTLGIDDIGCWGYRDDCHVTPADLVALTERAAAEIRSFGAEVVYAPWSGESHSDHRALHAAVVGALDATAFDGEALGYEVWTPMAADIVLDITSVFERKRAAIECYATQLRYVDYQHLTCGLNAYRSLHFQRGRGFAEAFTRLRRAGAASI